jgi:Leucine-rich repeat (LRR) protein
VLITDTSTCGLTNLTDFDLYKNNSITNDGLRTLTNLRVLDLSGNTNITAEGMSVFIS